MPMGRLITAQGGCLANQEPVPMFRTTTTPTQVYISFEITLQLSI